MIEPIIWEDFDTLFVDLLCELKDSEDVYVCKPRGTEVRELLVPTVVLENPRARLIGNPARESNYGFGVGEFLWYWRGADDLESMLYYNKRYVSFSDDGKCINSAYGKRLKVDRCIIEHATPPAEDLDDLVVRPITQWEACVETLRDDKDSRRAVMLINRPLDEAIAVVAGSKDVPCTLSLQFFIRDDELILHVNMRSNDVIWGLTYDLFSFTLLQECMLLELLPAYPNLKLGRYIHTAGSLHLYDRHYKMAAQIIGAERDMAKWKVQPMQPLTSLQSLSDLLEDERKLRQKEIEAIDVTRYSGAEFWMARQLNAHRQKRDEENAP